MVFYDSPQVWAFYYHLHSLVCTRVLPASHCVQTILKTRNNNKQHQCRYLLISKSVFVSHFPILRLYFYYINYCGTNNSVRVSSFSVTSFIKRPRQCKTQSYALFCHCCWHVKRTLVHWQRSWQNSKQTLVYASLGNTWTQMVVTSLY